MWFGIMKCTRANIPSCLTELTSGRSFGFVSCVFAGWRAGARGGYSEGRGGRGTPLGGVMGVQGQYVRAGTSIINAMKIVLSSCLQGGKL